MDHTTTNPPTMIGVFYLKKDYWGLGMRMLRLTTDSPLQMAFIARNYEEICTGCVISHITNEKAIFKTFREYYDFIINTLPQGDNLKKILNDKDREK